MPFPITSLPDLPELEQVTLETGRYYVHPETGERFDSVTTILKNADKSGRLEAWRMRVGEEEAEGISYQARTKGTHLHGIAEKYLLGDPDYAKDAAPFQMASFRKFQKCLDTSVSKLYGIEQRVFSRKLKAAGTTDVFCEWNSVPAILDWKTSKRKKKEDDILHYFVQATAYAVMMHERFGILVPKIIVVVFPDFEEPQVFEKRTSEYMADLKRIFITERPNV